MDTTTCDHVAYKTSGDDVGHLPVVFVSHYTHTHTLPAPYDAFTTLLRLRIYLHSQRRTASSRVSQSDTAPYTHTLVKRTVPRPTEKGFHLTVLKGRVVHFLSCTGYLNHLLHLGRLEGYFNCSCFLLLFVCRLL